MGEININRIELLAPAGSYQAFKGALENGANAVYLGAQKFSARQYANNFDLNELSEAVSEAHKRNVKIYVTANTLLNDIELKEIPHFLYELAQTGIDALIVQDLGLIRIAKNMIPELPLHGSTQMVINNSEGAIFMKNQGFERVVLARETSFKEMKSIKERAGVEIEAFGHGALCIAYSGMCLFSSMVGGRSGNRGRCAQPCRMAYDLVNGSLEKIEVSEGKHLLSPMDLNLIHHIPNLVESGVDSLKIEGRMKRPEYVSIVVKNYRKAIDDYYRDPKNFKVDKEMERELSQIFNRGFTTGHLLGKRRGKSGKEMMSYKKPNNRGLLLGRVISYRGNKIMIKLSEDLNLGDGYEVWVTKGGRIAGEIKKIVKEGMEVDKAYAKDEVELELYGRVSVGDRIFKTNDVHLMREAKDSYTSPKIKESKELNIKLKLAENNPIEFEAFDEEGYAVSGAGEIPLEQARNKPLTVEKIEEQFSKLGNTPFSLKDITVDGEEGLIVPIRELNNIRRTIVDLLLDKREKGFRRIELPSFDDLRDRMPDMESFVDTPSKVKLSISVGNYASAKKAIENNAKRVYFHLEKLKKHLRESTEELEAIADMASSKGGELFFVIPPIVHEADIQGLKETILSLIEHGCRKFSVGNLSGIQVLKELNEKIGYDELDVHGDFTLNSFNSQHINFLGENNIKSLTLSPELTLNQIGELSEKATVTKEIIVHGNFPIMTSEYCLIGSVTSKEDEESFCSGNCVKDDFYLSDRMGYKFPVLTDENCNMIVYNSKDLSLYKDFENIINKNIEYYRIEARKESPEWIGKTLTAYGRLIDRYNEKKVVPISERDLKELNQLSRFGTTSGHFFRGVE